MSDEDRVCLQSIKFAGERSAGHRRSQTNLAALSLRQAAPSRRISEDTQPLAGYLMLPDHAMRSGPREVVGGWTYLAKGGSPDGACP